MGYPNMKINKNYKVTSYTWHCHRSLLCFFLSIRGPRRAKCL